MIYNDNMLEQQIDSLYSKVKDLEGSNTNMILRTLSEVERMVYRYRDSTELLILLVRMEILNSQEQKARALARQAWQQGGNIRLMYEKMYLSDLINLGLVDMATVLIKSRLENFAENVKIFPLEMVRYALLAGNAPLLKKVAAEFPNNALFRAIAQFADTYQYKHYNEHFANIQRIVLESIGDFVCGFDFNFYTDRGFCDLDIVLYFSNYDFNLEQYKMLINNKIDGYCLTAGVKRIYNLKFVLRQIKDRRKF